MKQLSVALDLSPLSDGNKARGMGYYLYRLLPAMNSEIASNPDYRHFKLLTFTPPDPVPAGAQILHLPYFQPFFPSLTPAPKMPFIVTVPDLIPLDLPHLFPVGLKAKITWWRQKTSLLSARYLLTLSHFSKYSISRHTAFPLDRIFVSYLAASPDFSPVTSKKALQSIKNRYHLPDRFVLYVGDINTNKNIPLLVKTCQRLGYPLVIVGSSATKSNLTPHPWNTDLLWLQSQTNLLTLTGFVPDEDLPSVYSLATLYCQPSLSEGFGLPVVEAMACGCPVVYAIGSSLTEVMDYQGQFFDPLSSESLARALSAVWKSPKVRSTLSRAGLKRASVFSWRQTALTTLSTYQLLAHEIN